MGLTPLSRGKFNWLLPWIQAERLTNIGTILISAQTLGGAMAGGMLRGSLGYERAVSWVLSFFFVLKLCTQLLLTSLLTAHLVAIWVEVISSTPK